MDAMPKCHMSRSNHPEFLIDTPDYQGISREFESLQGLATRQMRRDESLQKQWLNEVAIRNSAEQLFEKYSRLELVIAGWADQAVLEFHSMLQGDERCLAAMLNELDAYRPAENGDICFYLADLAYQDVLATTFSFEDQTISAATFQRVRRVL